MKGPERGVLLSIVVVVALLIRVGYVTTTHVKDPLRTDAGQYVQYAHNLVHHGTYSLDEQAPPKPDAFRSPGYPLFLALTMWIAGEEHYYALARYTQVALGAAMVLLAFWLASLALPYAAALVVAVLVALSPHLVTSTGYILTETLFGFLLLGLLLVGIGARRQRPRTLLAAAAALAAAGLVNETALLLPVALAAVLWRLGAPRWVCAAFVGVVVVTGGSWAARNQWSVADGARGGADRARITMTHGSYPGWIHKDPRYRYSAYLEDPEQPEFGESWSKFASVLSERVQERPLRYLSWYLLEKPYYLWSWDILQGKGDIYVYPVAESLYQNAPVAEATRLLMKALHPVVLVLAALGVVLSFWWRRQISVATAVVAVTAGYFTLTYAVFAPWPRYSVPLRPELYLLATGTVAACLPRRRVAPVPEQIPQPHALAQADGSAATQQPAAAAPAP